MKDRVAMIHQPHFLPWPPYFIRALSVDVFVLLDDVKFNKDYFHNRTVLKNRDGKPYWCTLPIEHETRNNNIKDVKISKDFNLEKFIKSTSVKSPQLKNQFKDIQQLINKYSPNLAEINQALIEYIIDFVDNKIEIPKPEIIKSSEIDINSYNNDRTKRLIGICKSLECNGIIMGKYSRKCHDLDKLISEGISIYPALNEQDIFETKISIIDYLNDDENDEFFDVILKYINKTKQIFKGGYDGQTNIIC